MMSSLAINSFFAQPTDYAQRQSLAPTNKPDQNVKQSPALKPDSSGSPQLKKTGELSKEELKVVNELKKTDAEVKAHEAAHLAAAGGIALGGASFEYQQGPDGVRYAVSGEVNIDTSPVKGDPAATLLKADTIRRAAIAPANPSGQDLHVAASATAMAAQARAELLQKNQDSQNGNNNQRGTQINLSA